jgi:hypothetical protein
MVIEISETLASRRSVAEIWPRLHSSLFFRAHSLLIRTLLLFCNLTYHRYVFCDGPIQPPPAAAVDDDPAPSLINFCLRASGLLVSAYNRKNRKKIDWR